MSVGISLVPLSASCSARLSNPMIDPVRFRSVSDEQQLVRAQDSREPAET
jgi:hypothetical protein